MALFLSACMIVSMVVVPATAANFGDTTGHWGASSVDRWANAGILNGDGSGNFLPNKEMTRAEFAQMLCALMGYTEKAENTFTDVPNDAWYAEAILKLNSAGIMAGVGDNKAAPNDPISREQAAVLLCRAMNIKPSQDANIKFADADSVSDWAKDAVAALTERGMINGVGDGNFAPALNINRASVATMMDNMVAEYVTEDGTTITGEVNGVVIVKADNVKIEDATLSESVVVAPAAVAATVTLTGATQAADVVVAAENAKVVVAETAVAAAVSVEAPKAEAQVAGKVDTVAVTEKAEGAKATVTETATVTAVDVGAPNTEAIVAGKVDTVALATSAEGAKASVATTAEIKDVVVAAPNAKTSISGTVSNVAVADTATGANVTATTGAKVENVTTSAENVTVTGAKDAISTVTASGGSADIKANGAEVRNEGANNVTVDGDKNVASGESTSSTTTGTTEKPIEPPKTETNPGGGSSTGGSSGGSSSGGNSGGGNSGSDNPGGDTPPALVEETATMPRTGAELQALFKSADKVTVKANTDEANTNPDKNLLTVDDLLTIPENKSLILESGVSVKVISTQTGYGHLLVDGAVDIQGGNLENDGEITATSGDTLRVNGNFKNTRTLTVTATGRMVVEDNFSSSGTMELTKGAQILAKAFAEDIALPSGWLMSAEVDGDGYYSLSRDPNSGYAISFGSVVTVEREPETAYTDGDGKLTAPLPAAPVPTSDTVTFVEWRYLDDDGNEQTVTQDTVFTEDTRVYAYWKGWFYDAAEKVLFIFDDETMKENYDLSAAEDPRPWAAYTEQLETVDLHASVSKIGAYAFCDCINLTDVRNANTTAVGAYAFSGCANLEHITLSDAASIGACAFSGCANLSAVDLSNNLSRIEADTFNGCSALTKVSIPASVTSIGDRAFNGCSKLAEVEFGENSRLIEIGDYAFWKCNSLSEIDFFHGGTPEKWKSAMEGATNAFPIKTQSNPEGNPTFTISYNGGKIVIGDGWDLDMGVLTIYRNLFPESADTVPWKDYRSQIVTVNIKPDVTIIGDYAFYECGGLTNMTIPEGVTNIGKYAFYKCGSLESVTIPASVKSIGERGFSDCTKLSSVVFAEGSQLTSIEPYTFYNGNSLESVVLPNGVKSIKEAAFALCSNMTSVALPNRLENIGASAFSNCSALENVAIPSNVTSMGNSAFAYCSGMKRTVTNFGGDLIDWNNMTKGADALPFKAYPDIGKFTIQCRDDKIIMGEGWLFNETGHYLGITGELKYNNAATEAPWHELRPQIERAYILAEAKVVGKNALSDCVNLIDVVIEEGVTGIEESAFKNCTSLDRVRIPASVTSIGKLAFSGCTGLLFAEFAEDSALTTIGEYAFSGCTSFWGAEGATPTKLTSIKPFAFKGCTRLSSADIPEGVTIIDRIFEDCTNLERVTIPASVTRIESLAFNHCSKLAHVTFAEGTQLTHIAQFAFQSCDALKEITFGGTKEQWGSVTKEDSQISKLTVHCTNDVDTGTGWSFEGETGTLTLTEGAAGQSYFLSGSSSTLDAKDYRPWKEHRNAIRKVVITSGTTSIGRCAFYGCSNLTSVDIPNTVTNIGDSAFYDCSSLTSLVIPETVTDIGNYAFKNCTKLTSVNIPEGVQFIARSFENCTSLERVTIPASVYSISQNAFFGCTNLTNVTFVENGKLDYIGESAFHDCASLQSVTIPNTVQRMGKYAFSNCTSLTKVKLPENMTQLLEGSFSNCTKLTEVTIPANVNTINANAFSGCSSLVHVIFAQGSKLDSLDSQAFLSCPGLTEITFGNTKEEWNNGRIWAPNRVTVHCTNGEIPGTEGGQESSV